MGLPNILLVVLDSVRADRLSCYGYPRPTTPNLDAVAAEGLRFEAAYSESSWTVPACFTLLTGLAPREHQAETNRKLPAAMPTLPEILQRRGYFTFGASGNTFFGPRCGMQRGFDQFYMPAHTVRLTRPIVKYIAQRLAWTDDGGAALTATFLRAVRQAPQPWFAVLWYNDAHHPYIARRPFTARFCEKGLSFVRRMSLLSRMRRMLDLAALATEDDLAAIGGLYDGCVAYQDMLVGRLRGELQARGLLDDTLLIATADHGDMLGERKLMGHGPAADMYRPLVRVPLIVRGPGRETGATGALVQLADITHTLASAAGVADSLASTAAPRVDLLAAGGEGRPYALSEREPFSERRVQAARRKSPSFAFEPHLCRMHAVVEGGWRLIHRSDERHELYHLEADPEERANLIDSEPQRAAALLARVEEWRQRAQPHPSTTTLAPNDELIVEKRLQDLGYY